MTRILVRHVENLEVLMNTGLAEYKRWAYERIGVEEDLQHMPDEAKYIESIDLDIAVRIELPHVKSFVNKEELFDKMAGLAQITLQLMPAFAETNPNGTLKMVKRLWEASEERNIDDIFESDEQAGGTNQMIPAGNLQGVA